MTQLDFFDCLDTPVPTNRVEVPLIVRHPSQVLGEDAVVMECSMNHYIADSAAFWNDHDRLAAYLEDLRYLVRQERGVAFGEIQLERAAALRSVKARVMQLAKQ